MEDGIEHCSKFVVVACLERFKRGTNATNRWDYKPMINIVQSETFRTAQERYMVS